MKYGSIIFIFFLLIISTVLQSCKKSSPIDEKKFIKIYVDMIFMQDTSSLAQTIIKQKVLEKFTVNEKDYDATISYYNNDPEKWQKFFDSTIVYIESLKPKPTKKTDVKSLPKRSLFEDKKDL
ncbi:MAG: DUF4296 domain-containing protein [Ignavibacteriales bacterium]|nr:DUF4296 domain-containing protein [Ignavibacteriales bacterium]